MRTRFASTMRQMLSTILQTPVMYPIADLNHTCN